MTVGELYVIVEWSNIANFFKKHPEYPPTHHNTHRACVIGLSYLLRRVMSIKNHAVNVACVDVGLLLVFL